MDFTSLWNLVLVHPIEGALLGLTEFTSSAGLAIILFTVVVRTAMLPLSLQQIKSQKAMMALQPELKELQKRFGSDRAKMSQEQLRLYRERGVNPVAGCLPLLVQMPVWIALYSALQNLAHNQQSFHTGFLWIHNLAEVPVISPDPFTWPAILLPVLTAATQWIVQRMSSMPSADPQQQQMNRMMEIMPIMFLAFSFQVVAGLTLYWVVSNLYSIVQQRFTTGWGNLPYLGSSGISAPIEPSPDKPNSTSERPSTPSRRRASGRRRKGK